MGETNRLIAVEGEEKSAFREIEFAEDKPLKKVDGDRLREARLPGAPLPDRGDGRWIEVAEWSDMQHRRRPQPRAESTFLLAVKPPAAGDQPSARRLPEDRNLVRHVGRVTLEDRERLLGQRPVTLWLTGLSASGKSSIAYAVEERLIAAGHACVVLDGDNMRHGLNRDLGFSPEDRSENIRRVAEVARLMNEAGLIVITSFISPYAADRTQAREIIGEDRFLETFVDAPLEECERRDPKGLYAKARAGEITHFTGIDSPYQRPKNPDLRLTPDHGPDELADQVVELLEEHR